MDYYLRIIGREKKFQNELFYVGKCAVIKTSTRQTYSVAVYSYMNSHFQCHHYSYNCYHNCHKYHLPQRVMTHSH